MTAVRRTLTLLASAALSFAVAVPATPSLASSNSPAWACSPAEIGAASAGQSAEARGGPARGVTAGHGLVRDRDASQTVHDLPRAAKGRAPSNFSVTVPVFWHVVSDGAAGNVTRAQILGQISAINRGFSGGEGGAVTGFTFSLAGVTRSNNAVWYKSRQAAPSTL